MNWRKQERSLKRQKKNLQSRGGSYGLGTRKKNDGD